MIWKIFAYLRYLLTSKGRHGTHSPFVYSFVDECLRQQLPLEIKHEYKQYYNDLINDSSQLSIHDMGAGSKKLSTIRKVSSIAKVSGTSKRYGKLLYQISAYYKPKKTLELGTSLGLGTFMLAKGNPKGIVTTVEACPATQKVAQQQFKRYKINNVATILDTFSAFLATDTTVYDLIFIDGDHRGNKLLALLNQLEKNIHDETIIILDDIRWTKDMATTWNKIIENTNYHLTMDLFRMGIIAKRSHQQKEHFTIKF